MFSFPLGKSSVSTVMKVSMYCFYATHYLCKSSVHASNEIMFLLFSCPQEEWPYDIWIFRFVILL